MKKNFGNILMGLCLILLALYYLLGKLNAIPAFPMFKIIITIFLVAVFFSGLSKKHIFSPVMSIALLGCVYDSELGIEAITPWPIIFAGLAISIGLSLIFKHHVCTVNADGNNKYFKENGAAYGNDQNDTINGSFIRIESNFIGQTKYVRSNSLEKASIENNFGRLIVYFDQVNLSEGTPKIFAENNFGKLMLYVPSDWELVLNEETAFGNFSDFRKRAVPTDRKVILTVDSNFGSIELYDL
jgi:predicted membrane protein